MTLDELNAFALKVATETAAMVLQEYEQRHSGDLISRKEAARLLRCHTKTIDNRIKSGILDSVKIGANVLIKRDSLRAHYNI